MIPLGVYWMVARITFTVSPHATLPFCHAAFRFECSWEEGHCGQHWGACAWIVVCGCSGREFTTKNSCKLFCVIRFLWIRVEDSGTARQWLACMELAQKMGIRVTWTHQHLLSYHVKGYLILITMYLIFHLHRLFWNTAYFFLLNSFNMYVGIVTGENRGLLFLYVCGEGPLLCSASKLNGY